MAQLGKTNSTEQKIKRAFWQLYQQKKVNKITVREIITLAGCNRSTFYAYFADVYDLLERFENQLLPDLMQPAVQKIIAKNDISLSVEHCMQLYQKYKPYYQLLLGTDGDPSFRTKLTDCLGKIIKAHLTPTSEKTVFETDFLIEVTSSMIISSLMFYFKRADRPQAAEIINLITRVLNDGVSSELQWHILSD